MRKDVQIFLSSKCITNTNLEFLLFVRIRFMPLRPLIFLCVVVQRKQWHICPSTGFEKPLHMARSIHPESILRSRSMVTWMAWLLGRPLSFPLRLSLHVAMVSVRSVTGTRTDRPDPGDGPLPSFRSFPEESHGGCGWHVFKFGPSLRKTQRIPKESK